MTTSSARSSGRTARLQSRGIAAATASGGTATTTSVPNRSARVIARRVPGRGDAQAWVLALKWSCSLVDTSPATLHTFVQTKEPPTREPPRQPHSIRSIDRPLAIVLERLGTLRDRCIGDLDSGLQAVAGGLLTHAITPSTPPRRCERV